MTAHPDRPDEQKVNHSTQAAAPTSHDGSSRAPGCSRPGGQLDHHDAAADSPNCQRTDVGGGSLVAAEASRQNASADHGPDLPDSRPPAHHQSAAR
jgi:hypothetical protein